MTYLPFPTPFITNPETFTTTGFGTVWSVIEAPMRNWTMVVKGTGGAPTLWNVILEGSLDGTVFSKIMNHTTNTGDGQNLFSGTTLFPALYYRLNVATLTLGAATDIVVTVLGQQ